MLQILELFINDERAIELKDYKGNEEFFMVQHYGEKSWSDKDNNINITYLDSVQNGIIDLYKKDNWEIIDFR